MTGADKASAWLELNREDQERLHECVAEVANGPPNGIDTGLAFDALGIDSLDRFSLAVAIEECFGIQVPDSLLVRMNCLNDIAAHLIATKGRAA